MLVSVKQQLAGADDATADKLSKEYQAWLQSAAVADAKAEIEGLQVRSKNKSLLLWLYACSDGWRGDLQGTMVLAIHHVA